VALRRVLSRETLKVYGHDPFRLESNRATAYLPYLSGSRTRLEAGRSILKHFRELGEGPDPEK